ncbi:hypothetical protein FRC17_009918 [Serendipita sp. 399]|nr:hypothetical protein FRC17_009918 [Serendipita sp. 399]
MTSRYRPTLLRRDSVSSRWNHKVEEEGKDEKTTTSARPAAIVLPAVPTSATPAQSATQLAALKARFYELSEDNLSTIILRFHKIPSSKIGWISQSAAITAAQAHEGVTYNKARETMKTVRADATDTLALEDWVEFIARLRSNAPAAMVPGTRSGTFKMRGSHAEISHSIDEDERVEFTEYINTALASDPDVGSRMPLPTDTMQIFDECRDGLIICKLIEHIFPGTIDSVMSVRRLRGTSYINLPRNGHPLNKFQIAENNNIAILAAQAIGANVVNMSGQDIAEGREHLILSLIGQIIRLATSDKPKVLPKHTAVFTTPLPLRRSSLPAPMSIRSQPSPPPYSRSRSMSVSVDDDEVTRVAPSVIGQKVGKAPNGQQDRATGLKNKMMEIGAFKLFEDVKSGVIILEALEKVAPERPQSAVPTTQVPSRSTTPALRRRETLLRPAPKSTSVSPKPAPPLKPVPRAESPKPIPRATSPKPTVVKPAPRPFIIPVRQSPKLGPIRPVPKPLIIPEKEQTPSAGGAGYGIDAGIIAQRQALLQSIKSRA